MWPCGVVVDTLRQIAYALGYAEPGPLVRAFKRWTNETPMQYRHKHR
ncbi:helix-turn-helix domain-containing protein [Reyranella soli]